MREILVNIFMAVIIPLFVQFNYILYLVIETERINMKNAKIIEKKYSPNIDILVANEKEIMVLCPAEQILINELKCIGAIYPINLDKKTQLKCYELSKKVGVAIAKKI